MSDALTISCDEAGHTGPDLLHADQRYFAFASVSIDDTEAFDIIAKARRDNPVQMPELKAAKLMRSSRGRKLVGSIIESCAGRFAVNTHEKLLALCGWIFEYIYEPVYKDDPRLLYEKNFHRFVAMYGWLWLNQAGSDAEESVRQFQHYMRTLDETKAPLLFSRIQQPLSDDTEEHPFELILRFAHGYRERIIADNANLAQVAEDKGRWTLDLSVSALWSHLNHWGRTNKPLKVRCDASKPLETFSHKFSGDNNDPGIRRAREMFKAETLGWKLLQPIEFVDSRNFPAVQIADVIAGTAISLLSHNIDAGMEAVANELQRGMLADSIFPDMEILNLKNRSTAVNWLILYDLAKRAERGADPHRNLDEMYRQAEISWARGDFPSRSNKPG